MLTQELCMGQMAFTIIKLQFSENIDDAVVFLTVINFKGWNRSIILGDPLLVTRNSLDYL